MMKHQIRILEEVAVTAEENLKQLAQEIADVLIAERRRRLINFDIEIRKVNLDNIKYWEAILSVPSLKDLEIGDLIHKTKFSSGIYRDRNQEIHFGYNTITYLPDYIKITRVQRQPIYTISQNAFSNTSNWTAYNWPSISGTGTGNGGR